MGKLVRDSIPDLIEQQTDTRPKGTRLSPVEKIEALKKKIQEEADELIRARSRKEVREELGDVSEALDELLRELRISPEELEFVKAKKRAAKGGFSEGIYLDV